MNTSRRTFIGGMFMAAAGCKTGMFAEKPELTFGVISDIHLTNRDSAALYAKSLRYFRNRGVDAVMLPGDISDGGVVSSLQLAAEVWDGVFKGCGSKVARLFCTGNHDFDGYWYGDMKRDLDVKGLGGGTPIVKAPGGMKAVWEKVFKEPFAPVRVRTVKGYDFVSAEWNGFRDVGKWMGEHAPRFYGRKPFFYFQHPPARGTTSDSFGWADEGNAFAALKNFPNAVAFTGHAHAPFCDERSIWQGEFTAIATPSLSYAGFPKGHENGGGARNGTARNAMQKIPARLDLRGGQGYYVSVYADHIEVERIDLEEDGAQDLPAWIFPVCGERPYELEKRAAASLAPRFPEGAMLKCSPRNTEDRSGRWIIAMTCEFPTAIPPEGMRVFDYEIRAVPADGSAPMVKRFLSPAYHRLACYEPATQRFWFNVDELPRNRVYGIEVYARNCYGKCSSPIKTGPFIGC